MIRKLKEQSWHTQFNLISWFAFFGLLAILFTSIVTSYLLSTYLEEHLLRRDAAVMEDFVARIAQHHDPRGYFAQSYSPAGDPLNDFFEDIAHMPDVARINAFALDGTIVWSSDVTMIGRKFSSNDELEKALTGELVYEKGGLDRVAKAEHLENQPNTRAINWFVENYIPIRDRDTQQIVGVVEIYRIPLALSQSISSGRRLVWICIFLGGLVLFLSLYGVIRRGQQLISSQQRSLMRQTRLATIGEMASSVAHSIRNPIASIRSSAELALDGVTQPEIGESLEDIINEVDRFDGWIRELLVFTADSSDSLASARLQEVVRACLLGIEKRAERQRVRVENKVSSSVPDVRADPTLLAQVVNSLLANALDAMPHGGKVVVDALDSDDVVRLTLSDTGFGIPPDQLEGLFDPLVTHKNGGLGIGLALAKQIVVGYGGLIDISSGIGTGTTVAIELPIGAQAS